MSVGRKILVPYDEWERLKKIEKEHEKCSLSIAKKSRATLSNSGGQVDKKIVK